MLTVPEETLVSHATMINTALSLESDPDQTIFGVFF